MSLDLREVRSEACLLPIEATEKVGAVENCTHIFHFGCVEKWSQTENSCPQCKVRFFWMAARHYIVDMLCRLYFILYILSNYLIVNHSRNVLRAPTKSPSGCP